MTRWRSSTAVGLRRACVDDSPEPRAPALPLVAVDNPRAAAVTLRRAGVSVDSDGSYLRVALPPSDAAHVTKLLADAGMYVSELRPDSVSLEELFLRITTHEQVAS